MRLISDAEEYELEMADRDFDEFIKEIRSGVRLWCDNFRANKPEDNKIAMCDLIEAAAKDLRDHLHNIAWAEIGHTTWEKVDGKPRRIGPLACSSWWSDGPPKTDSRCNCVGCQSVRRERQEWEDGKVSSLPL
jgi:hypothetical protein